MKRKELIELTRDELSALYTVNDYVKNVERDGALMDANFAYENEIVFYFRHYDREFGRTRYSCVFDENYGRAVVSVPDDKYRDFLDDARDFYTNGCYLGGESENAETIRADINRLLTVVDKYRDFTCGYADISDENYARLEKFFESKMNGIRHDIERQIDELYDGIFDDEYNRERFIESVCNEQYDGYTTDGRYVYFETCKS